MQIRPILVWQQLFVIFYHFIVGRASYSAATMLKGMRLFYRIGTIMMLVWWTDLHLYKCMKHGGDCSSAWWWDIEDCEVALQSVWNVILPPAWHVHGCHKAASDCKILANPAGIIYWG